MRAFLVEGSTRAKTSTKIRRDYRRWVRGMKASGIYHHGNQPSKKHQDRGMTGPFRGMFLSQRVGYARRLLPKGHPKRPVSARAMRQFVARGQDRAVNRLVGLMRQKSGTHMASTWANAHLQAAKARKGLPWRSDFIQLPTARMRSLQRKEQHQGAMRLADVTRRWLQANTKGIPGKVGR